METTQAAAIEQITLGTIRRYCHSIRIHYLPSEGADHLLALSLIRPREHGRDLGAVVVAADGTASPLWEGVADEIGLVEGSLFASGLIETCKAVSEAIRDQAVFIGARHGFKVDRDCPFPIVDLEEGACR